MINVIAIGSRLKNISYHYNTPDKKVLSVSIADRIEVKENNSENAILSIYRDVTAGDGPDFLISVEFEINFKCDTIPMEEDIVSFFSSNMPGVEKVFSRISLLIAEITSFGPIGPIVSPPLYLQSKS